MRSLIVKKNHIDLRPTRNIDRAWARWCSGK